MSWMTDEQIDWLLEGTAEMMEHPEVAGDLQVTPELALAINEYEAALERSLRACLTRLGSTAPSELTSELMGRGDASLNVLHTLRGEGVGIWDGRWDEYFQSEQQIDELQRCLVRDLSKFADDTGGGSLNDAFMNAVFDAVGEDLAPNATGGPVDEHAVDELLLWIDNTAELSPGSSRGQGHAIAVNLLRKRRKGTFDPKLSIKAWEHLATAAAKDYARQVGDRRSWHAQFSPATRRAVAASLAERFVSDADGGEYDHVDLSIRR